MSRFTDWVPRSRAGVVTMACVVAVLAAGAGLVAVSQTVGGSDVPPKAPAFVAPAKPSFKALDVKSRDGTRLTLIEQRGETAVQQDVLLTDAVRVERLTPMTAADLKVGDWMTVIGIPNTVKSFAIHAVVVLPGATGERVDGAMRSQGGFLGYETSRNLNDRPVLGGVVESVEHRPCAAPTAAGLGGNPAQQASPAPTPGELGVCGDIRLTVPTGTATVHLEPGARFYRLETVPAGDVKEGDRIAGAFDGAPPKAVLVLPNEGG